MSVINTGRFKGEMHCEPTVAAMKKCLARFKLYPFSTTI
jgi:hypothetical protein